ncbi:MAG: IS3 family transposase, partial [Senegalimassilia anaerobia]
DLDAYVVHWNTRRRQVKLKGLTPEEFRSQSLVA